MNILAKVSKVETCCKEIVNSKTIIMTCLVYYGNDFSEDLAKQCLLTFHSLCKQNEFRETCFNVHKYPVTLFDTFVR